MASPQVPKYQAIYSALRQRILDGELAPGSRLPPQQELADSFGVTLMTLRQAVAALESDGLVWAARGKGTFVVERPVDVSVGNLSSFAQEMHSAGVAMNTEVLATTIVAATEHAPAAAALETTSELRCLTRRRSVGGLPFSLQRSYLLRGAGAVEPGVQLVGDSLYDTLESSMGWTVAEARESITAVGLNGDDAAMLDAEEHQPALLSIRTSINQFGRPFLYDEALLVGGRCTITANRTSDRLSLHYGVPGR